MTINFTAKTIELTASEMKKASVYGQDEYTALQDARKDYPNFKVIVKKANRKAPSGAKLTKEMILYYVDKAGTEEQKRNLTLLDEVTFFELKQWFFGEFENLKSMSNIDLFLAIKAA